MFLGAIDVVKDWEQLGEDRTHRHLVSNGTIALDAFSIVNVLGLKPLQITEIARHAERIVYKAGQVLIEDGKAGDAAIIVAGGEAVRTRAPMSPAEHEEAIELSLAIELRCAPVVAG